MNGKHWTDEDVAVLRRLHRQGQAASQIAITLRTTRNAVLGKLFRLGLCVKGGRRKHVALRRQA